MDNLKFLFFDPATKIINSYAEKVLMANNMTEWQMWGNFSTVAEMFAREGATLHFMPHTFDTYFEFYDNESMLAFLLKYS